jgi:hypothetical protein
MQRLDQRMGWMEVDGVMSSSSSDGGWQNMMCMHWHVRCTCLSISTTQQSVVVGTRRGWHQQKAKTLRKALEWRVEVGEERMPTNWAWNIPKLRTTIEL